ncbi:MAG: glycerol kinase, partial [Betaproteobacteria bacterium]|nr:glycerol kinase [Betaproteobacteria bacterium]
WNSQWATARAALNKAGLKAQDVAGIGITNQRETTIVWNRRTGEPVYNAIVWQDRRAEPACSILRERGYGEQVQRTTGLVIDAYFSATKLQWILDSVPGAREAATRGELAFGTVDCWLLWKLTGGRKHATDVSNAARTMLFDIHRNTWDEDLLKLFNIPPAVLPEVHPSAWQYGETDPEILGAAVPIGGMAGDQQSALFGQACFHPGLAKNTYGTGCFMLLHTGAQGLNSANGLITTSTAQTSTTPTFALEGSVFIGGAVVQWLRDGLGVIEQSSDVQALAESVPDSGGVVFVPAFTGLGAPYWRADARGAILGLTRGVSAAHIARAALESIAFQSAALLLAMSRDAIAAGGHTVQELRVDGGACVNNLLMQFQADLLGIPVVRPRIIETTALGAAWLAALGLGIHGGTDALESQWQIERR